MPRTPGAAPGRAPAWGQQRPRGPSRCGRTASRGSGRRRPPGQPPGPLLCKRAPPVSPRPRGGFLWAPCFGHSVFGFRTAGPSRTFLPMLNSYAERTGVLREGGPVAPSFRASCAAPPKGRCPGPGCAESTSALGVTGPGLVQHCGRRPPKSPCPPAGPHPRPCP